MAGDFERLKWVLELELSDAAFRQALESLESRFNRVLQSARTPGSGPVTGVSPNALSAQAGQIAAEKSLLDSRLREGVRTQAITQDFAKEARQRLAALSQASFLGALGERSTGKIDPARATAQYTATRDRLVDTAAQQKAADAAAAALERNAAATNKSTAVVEQEAREKASQLQHEKELEARVFAQLADSNTYARATAEAAKGRMRLGANVEQILAREKQYAASLAVLTSGRARIDADTQAILAGDSKYIEATASAAISRARQNAGVQTILAGDQKYAQSVAEAATQRARQTANVQEILAGDQRYVTATAEAAKSRARSNANIQAVLAADDRYAESMASAATSRARTNANIQSVLAGDQRYASATAEAATQRARQTANVQEILAGDQRYAKATATAAIARAQSNANVQEILAADSRYASATIQATIRRTEQNAAIQSGLAGDKRYAEASAQAAIARARQGADTAALLAADADYITAQAEAANSKRLTAARTKAETLAGAGIGGAAGIGQLESLNASNAVAARLSRARVSSLEGTLLAQEQNRQVLIQERVIQNQLNNALKVGVAAAEKEAFDRRVASGDVSPGTLFQRMQSFVSTRQSGNFRDPNEFQTFKQFLGSKFLTTAGFAVSGATTYAAFAGVRQMIAESTKLEQVLALVQAQFNALGDSAGFDKAREGILSIARETGTMGNEVAQIFTQFKGAFSNLNTNEVLTETRSAVELAKVTGLSLTEITDQLTAASIDYGVTIQHVGDVTVALQQRTGVLAKETIKFVSDLGPIAVQAGASFEQIATQAAIAQKTSGRSAQAISDSYARVLSEIQKNGGAIIQFFNQFGGNTANKIIDQLTKGNTFAVFDEIGKIYAQLSKPQQNQILSLLGNRRDTQNIVGLLANYKEYQSTLGEVKNANGTLDESFKKIQNTLGQAAARLAEAFRQLGIQLLRSGLSDAIQTIINDITLLVKAGGGMLAFFADLNDSLGGIPLKLVAISLLLNSMAKLFVTLRNAKITGGVANVLGFGGPTSGLGGFASNFGVAKSLTAEGAASGLFGGAALRNVATGGGFGAAAGALAGGGGLATALGAITPLGWAAIGTVAVFATVNKYMDVRNQARKDAEAKLSDLEKKDRASLEELAKKDTPAGEGVSRFIKGEKTNAQLAKDAVQELDTRESLDPILQNYITAAKDDKDARSSIQALKDKLDKKKGKDDKANKQVSQAIKDAQEISTKTNLSPTQLSIEFALSDPRDSDTGNLLAGDNAQIRIGNNFYNNQLQDRIKALQKEKAAIDKETDPDKRQKLLEKYRDALKKEFNNPDININDVATSFAGLAKEFASHGTLFGRTPEQLERDGDVVRQFGVNVRDLYAGGNRAAKAIEQLKEDMENLAEIPVLQFQYDRGQITSTKFLAKLNAVIPKQKAYLNKLIASLKNGTLTDVTQLTDQLNAYQQLITAAEKTIQDQIDGALSNAKLDTTIGGEGADVTSPKVEAAVTELLKIPGLSEKQRLALANEYVDAQKAFVQFQADNAASADQAKAIIEKGTKLPQNIREIFIANELTGLGGIVDETFQALADAGLGSIEEVRHTVAKIIAAGGDVEAFLADNLQKLLDQALAAAAAGVFGGGAGDGDTGVDRQKLAAKVAQLRAAADKSHLTAGIIDRGTQDVPTTTSPPEKETSQAETNSKAKAIADAKFDLLKAIAGPDNVKLAQIAQAQADSDAYFARLAGDQAGEISAAAAHVRANRDLLNATFERANAHTDLQIALANASGDTIKAAKYGVQQARDKINQLKILGVAADDPAVTQANIELVNRGATLRDDVFNKGLDDINFELDMGKISTAQAISKLQNLESTSARTEDQRRQIERQIKQLKDQVSGDLQFNLPDIILPTFYEARRLKQQGVSGFAASYVGQGQNFTDNRQINVVITAQTNATPKDIANAVAAEMNKPSTFGTSRTLY